MVIFNIRMGHACNSSSSHSIVPASALITPVDDRATGSGEFAFGWEWFTLVSADEKMKYLAVQMRETGWSDTDIKEITGVDLPPASENYYDSLVYVDHQSVRPLPDGPWRKEFVRDLAAWLRRDDVVVRGGNDNDDDPLGDLPSYGVPWGGAWTARPDLGPGGARYWSLFSPVLGHKIRFSFARVPIEQPWEPGSPDFDPPILPLYASAPELVDLKITDFCPFAKDCPWCYMDSGREGEHASLDTVIDYIDEFAELGVFEVAVGGGEPTLWPHLAQLASYAASRSINLNMTTKNFAWVRQQDGHRDVLTNVRALAFSINSARDLDRLRDLYAQVGPDGSGMLGPDATLNRTEATVQCIPAFISGALIQEIAAFCSSENLRLTFLGVKRVGRGKHVGPADDDKWIAALKAMPTEWLDTRIAVDTLMAAACEQAFKDAGISPLFYATGEGGFSCYVDAIRDRVGASSYVDDDQMVPHGGSLKKAFEQVQERAGLRQQWRGYR